MTFASFTSILLIAATLVALVPSLVLLVEVVAALWPTPPGSRVTARSTRMTIVVPAHDEEAQIADTVRGLCAELGPGDRLLVVADNCGDRTAALAREAGAEVVERQNPSERGKGFAISFAVAHLAADPPDVVVLVDADCNVVGGRLAALAESALAAGTAVQADYLLTAGPDPSGLGPINAFAILVRNRVRPLGLHRLARACQLTGSGMAFPWPLLASAPAMRGHLVEDMALGLELALRGQPARLCPEVRVASLLPGSVQAGLGQRRRWEHGQLSTMAAYVPRLLGAFLRHPKRALLGLALDLVVPPLTLLAILQVTVFSITGLAALAGLVSIVPWLIATLAGGCVLVATVLAWLVFGRQTLSLGTALQIPFYVLWKAGLYAALFVTGKQKTWERTERDPPAGADRTP